jgi:hypothetical protein
MFPARRTEFAADVRNALSFEQICIREVTERGGLCILLCNFEIYNPCVRVTSQNKYSWLNTLVFKSFVINKA